MLPPESTQRLNAVALRGVVPCRNEGNARFQRQVALRLTEFAGQEHIRPGGYRGFTGVGGYSRFRGY